MKNEDLIKKLTEKNDELENYFRNTIIPQLFIDENLILRKYTPPAMKQFHLSSNDLGKSIYNVVNNFRFPALIDNINYVIATAEILEKEIQTTDFRWYQMNILPYIKQIDKKTNGVIVTFVDITYRIKDLKEQEKLIADHETVLDTISHEIKNPLTSLLLSIEMLHEDAADSSIEFKQLLKILETGVKKIESVINELTEVRKRELNYNATPELLNFENIIEDVRLALIDDVTITSEIHISEIFFSRRKLRRIIYTIINNVLKYKSTGHKPAILIKTRKEHDFIILTIKGTRTGLDSAIQEDLFTKYYGIKNGNDNLRNGLHLVEEIVTNAGGKILIESKIGQGTECNIFLKVS